MRGRGYKRFLSGPCQNINFQFQIVRSLDILRILNCIIFFVLSFFDHLFLFASFQLLIVNLQQLSVYKSVFTVLSFVTSPQKSGTHRKKCFYFLCWNIVHHHRHNPARHRYRRRVESCAPKPLSLKRCLPPDLTRKPYRTGRKMSQKPFQ